MRKKYWTFSHKALRFLGVEANLACNRIEIGDNCVMNPFISLGYEGFGFERNTLKGYDKPIKRRDHPYGVVIGDKVEIGSHTTIHRGRWRDTMIGDGTKIDAGVHIAHNVVIGKDCFLVSGTVIGGSCTIGNDCFIGENVCIRQGIKIVDNVTIGMGSVVTKDIRRKNSTWIGNPAKKLYNYQKL